MTNWQQAKLGDVVKFKTKEHLKKAMCKKCTVQLLQILQQLN